MPIITVKVIVISVTIKASVKATAGKIVLSLAAIRSAISTIARIVNDIRQIHSDLLAIRTALREIMEGTEANTFFTEFDQYCNAVSEMGDCIDGCRVFLQQSHDEYEAAETQSRSRANELSNTRARG